MRELRLGEFLAPSSEAVELQPNVQYDTVGVMNHGRGLFHRPPVLGRDVTYPRYFRLSAGQFVYSRLFAWEGSVAVVGSDFDGRFVSPEFPTFSVDRRLATPAFLDVLTKWPVFWSRIRETETGMGGRRKRVYPEALLTVEVPLPALDQQDRIVDLIAHLDVAIREATRASTAGNALLRAAREDWVTRLWATTELAPLGDLVERVRRPISVDPSGRYSELGVRSHGRGIFHKPAVSGSALGSKAVFSIQPGDLVLNIVFAWERAVAVATSADAGRSGSHRFPTYTPRDDVLIEYVLHTLLSDRGHELMQLASPGSAGRNRTLNQTALLASHIPWPSVETQREFVGVVEGIADTTRCHDANLTSLGTVRDALLHDLLSGAHTIPPSYDRFLDGPT